MSQSNDEMVRKIQLVGELHEFGVELMRRRLVDAHGEVEGERRLREWKTADRWQGPGRPSTRRLERPEP